MTPAPCVADWLAEVDNLALSSTVASPKAQAGYIRAMAVLLDLRPRALGGAGLCAARYANLMQNVGNGAFESAVLHLLPHTARIMTSTPGPGRHLATVRLEGQRRESTSSGSTFALALVGAFALSIVDLHHERTGVPH